MTTFFVDIAHRALSRAKRTPPGLPQSPTAYTTVSYEQPVEVMAFRWGPPLKTRQEDTAINERANGYSRYSRAHRLILKLMKRRLIRVGAIIMRP